MANTIMEEMRKAIDDFTEINGYDPDILLLSPENYSRAQVWYGTGSSYINYPMRYLGIIIEEDPTVIKMLACRVNGKPEHIPLFMQNRPRCVCGSKNPKGAGHSTWCEIWVA